MQCREVGLCFFNALSGRLLWKVPRPAAGGYPGL